MRRRDSVAVPAGADPAALTRALRAAHEVFVSTGTAPRGVRSVVADSWLRSIRSGVDPERPLPPVDLGATALDEYRTSHLIAPAMPIVRRLMVDGLAGLGLVAALADDTGRLLWVEGDRSTRRSLERVGFVEGASWSEQHAGTNAPGTALATGQPVQVFGAEHFTRTVQAWSCSAAPVRDPSTGRVLGVLDATGKGDEVASPLMLSVVRATVTAIELELKLAALEGQMSGRSVQVSEDGQPPAGPGDAVDPHEASDPGFVGEWSVLGSSYADLSHGPLAAVRLDVLGPGAGTLHGRHPGQVDRLSLRHAELLLLLAEHPRGLTGEELAALLHPGRLSDVTVRAELSRLRRLVGRLLGASRPYRLAAPLVTDADLVRGSLAVGDLRGALAAYVGPVLPRSIAPGIERVRAELGAEVRSAVLAHGGVADLERWVACDEGAEDWQAWERFIQLSPGGSPRWARARGHLDLLTREQTADLGRLRRR